jgi:hypothetical protein
LNKVTDSLFGRMTLGVLVLVLGSGIFLSVLLLQRVGSFGSHSETSVMDRLLLEVGKSAEASVLKNTQDHHGSSYNGTGIRTGGAPLIPLSTDRSGPALPDGHPSGRRRPTLGTGPDFPRGLSSDNPSLSRPIQPDMREDRSAYASASASARGGTSDVANFRDSANLVVRDGSGRLKQHRTER